VSTDLIDLTRLSSSDRFRLLGEIWDGFCQSPEELPMTDWQKTELDRRKAEAIRNPESGERWEVVRERLRRGQT
jgi:putative addiction module component (TIGR02574 family)